jgi:hypothetical protein
MTKAPIAIMKKANKIVSTSMPISPAVWVRSQARTFVRWIVRSCPSREKNIVKTNCYVAFWRKGCVVNRVDFATEFLMFQKKATV